MTDKRSWLVVALFGLYVLAAHNPSSAKAKSVSRETRALERIATALEKMQRCPDKSLDY